MLGLNFTKSSRKAFERMFYQLQTMIWNVVKVNTKSFINRNWGISVFGN